MSLRTVVLHLGKKGFSSEQEREQNTAHFSSFSNAEVGAKINIKFYIPPFLDNEFVAGLCEVQQDKSSFRSSPMHPGLLQDSVLRAP